MWLFLPKILVKTKIDKHSLKSHFKETLIYFIPAVATSLYTVLDKTLIGSLIPGTTTVIIGGKEYVKKTSEIENGYYEQATKVIDIVKTVAFVSIHSVMCSRANYLYKIEDKKQINSLINNTFELTLFLSIGAAFGLIGISSVFVPTFFGAGYDKTIIILRILACLVPIICVSGALGSVYYTPIGKRKQSALILVIGSLINLVLSWPLIILFKSIGASIASITAELIISILYFSFCKKAISFKKLFSIIWKKVIAGAIMLLALFIIVYYDAEYSYNKYVTLIKLLLVGAATYISVLLVLRDQSLTLFKSFFIKKSELKKENLL